MQDFDASTLPPIPEVTFGPVTRATLALYAGASGDHNPVHIDSDYAKAAGLPDVFAHGMLSFGILARVTSEWAAYDRLVTIATRFMALTHIGDTVTCRGELVEVFEEAGELRGRVKLAAVTQDGRQTLGGDAVVALRR